MPNCTTYHNDPARTGWFRGTEHGVAAVSTWSKIVDVDLGAAVRGAPLLLERWKIKGGPHNTQVHDIVFVTTSANLVNAHAVDQLRARVAAPLWSTALPTASYRTGSNIPAPVGICGTPVIDETAGRLHVLALERVDNGQPPGPNDVGAYHVHVLDVNSGAILSSHQLVDPGAAGRPTFDGNLQDQRGALNLVHGWVYAGFADFLAYDAGPYHGWVVGWEAENPARQHFFPTTRNVVGGGAWGPGGVASGADHSLFVATGNGGTDANYWNSLDGGTLIGNKYTSPETSPRSPALCGHDGKLFIAWKGDGNDNLNVARVNIGGDQVTGLAGKVTLGDTSPVSPSIASLGGRLYIAWKGDGNDNLNVMYSRDGGATFGHKFTSGETSPQPPALCAHNGHLYIAWKGDGNDNLNVAQVQLSGQTITGFANKVTLGDTSPLNPSLASIHGRLYLAWKGDGNDFLNVMYSSDDGATFGHKYVSAETSPQAPVLTAHNHSLYIAWKGDGNDQLNFGQVLLSEDDITGIDKGILSDTSPVGPALASVEHGLYIGWKGDGNDNLNVMFLASPGLIGDFMESVVRLRANSHGLSVKDWYTPVNAQSLDAADQDVGGSSPMVLPTIHDLEMLVVTAKDGNVYLVDRRHMGHWGGALWRESVFGSESKCAPAYFHTPARDHLVYFVGGGAPGLIAYKVVVHDGRASLDEVWRATSGGIALGDAPGSPAMQSFPDWPGGVVWIVDDTKPALRAFDALTGAELYSSDARAADKLAAVAHFPPITCATSGVFVGRANGFSLYGP